MSWAAHVAKNQNFFQIYMNEHWSVSSSPTHISRDGKAWSSQQLDFNLMAEPEPEAPIKTRPDQKTLRNHVR